jgi:ABC-type phosphate transport system ATPase subunit
MLTGLGRFRALRADKSNVQHVKRRHRAWKDDDVAGDIRNTKRFRELAALLRERAGQEGVMLVGGEAEIILADRVTAIASQLRVTQRTALDYVSEENLELLIQKLSSLAEE